MKSSEENGEESPVQLTKRGGAAKKRGRDSDDKVEDVPAMKAPKNKGKDKLSSKLPAPRTSNRRPPSPAREPEYLESSDEEDEENEEPDEESDDEDPEYNVSGGTTVIHNDDDDELPVIPPPKKRASGPKLTPMQQEAVLDFYKSHPVFFDKKLLDFRAKAKKIELLEQLASDIGVPGDLLGP